MSTGDTPRWTALDWWICAWHSGTRTFIRNIVTRRSLPSYTRPLLVAFFVFQSFGLTIHDTVHALSFVIIIFSKTAHTGSSSSASTRAFVVAGQGIASCELAATFRTYVRSLASVELGMSFEIVEASEPGLAGGAYVWLFLRVGQKVALEIMMTGKLGCAVWASVLLAGRGPRTLSCP
jgi:hypothetical protein